MDSSCSFSSRWSSYSSAHSNKGNPEGTDGARSTHKTPDPWPERPRTRPQHVRAGPASASKRYTKSDSLGGANAVVSISLSEINQWNDDVAAYAIIYRVRSTDGRASFVGEGDIERFQSMGFWEDIDVVDFGLYLYGPIRARTNLIAVET